MWMFYPVTWGVGSVTSTPPDGPQWAHRQRGRQLRVFPPRIRHEYWVEVGHQETDDPATDTREG